MPEISPQYSFASFKIAVFTLFPSADIYYKWTLMDLENLVVEQSIHPIASEANLDEYYSKFASISTYLHDHQQISHAQLANIFILGFQTPLWALIETELKVTEPDHESDTPWHIAHVLDAAKFIIYISNNHSTLHTFTPDPTPQLTKVMDNITNSNANPTTHSTQIDDSSKAAFQKADIFESADILSSFQQSPHLPESDIVFKQCDAPITPLATQIDESSNAAFAKADISVSADIPLQHLPESDIVFEQCNAPPSPTIGNFPNIITPQSTNSNPSSHHTNFIGQHITPGHSISQSILFKSHFPAIGGLLPIAHSILSSQGLDPGTDPPTSCPKTAFRNTALFTQSPHSQLFL
jgi:hypothetical protein